MTALIPVAVLIASPFLLVFFIAQPWKKRTPETAALQKFKEEQEAEAWRKRYAKELIRLRDEAGDKRW